MSSTVTSEAESAVQERLATSQRRSVALRTTVVLLIAISIVRIAATYPIYCQTMDEPEHIAGGIEWWQRASFTMDALHMPLGPALIGLGPTLSGAHIGSSNDAKVVGAAYLDGLNGYVFRLTIARAGVLPLLVLGVIVVALWARRLAGDAGGIAAVLLFTTAPPVLAHAGLATTDTAAEATFVFALFAFVLWLGRPSAKSTLVLGIAGGLALSAKLTNIPFLCYSGAAIVLARLLLQPRGGDSGATWWKDRRLAMIVLSMLCAVVILWGMYFFSFGVVGRSGAPVTPGWGQVISTWRVPAPQVWRAVIEASVLSHTGKVSYLLGARQLGGSLAFFPIAVLVKTPIPMLALAFVGSLLALLNGIRERDWRLLAPLLGAVAVMGAAMSSNLNIGLRHVLAIYPLLAIVGGYGVAELWKLRPQLSAGARQGLAVGVVALLVWQAAEGAVAHPDYLPYFNQFAGGHGEEILVDSDLDWGQDLFRLRDELQQRHIDHLWLSYFGSAEPEKLGITGSTELPTFTPVTGWVAISEFHLKRFPTAFAWLREYRPVKKVGKSILLYKIEPRQ